MLQAGCIGMLGEVWHYTVGTGTQAHVATVVPALGDPRRERPPALYGHVINSTTDTFQR